MKAQVFSNNMQIGTTELLLGDESMGCLYGVFLPSEDYYTHVQKAVWEFWSSSRPDYKKWNSLKFNVQLDNGYFLFPDGGFTIDDVEAFPDHQKRIDVAGIDRSVIEGFFLQKKPRPFVEEPWESISIEQKIGFETELKKELGTNEYNWFWELFSSTASQHPLANYEFSALCHDSRNDDVLFIARTQRSAKKFVVVHLTWKGSKEIDNFPRAQFYEDFDDFKYTRMYPDKADWEY